MGALNASAEEGKLSAGIPPRISVELDEFRYPDGTVALAGLRYEVSRGACAALVGANGSGKTTLLRVISGLAHGYRGSVRLDGVELRELKRGELHRRVGLVFQNPDDQLFAATVAEDVAFGPRNQGLDEAEVKRRVHAALESVGVGDCAGRSIHHLSHGQKKRVCIAGLLAMGHETLLLDEPTAGLDPEGEQRMLGMLRALNDEGGVTVVMATHAVDLLPTFATRIHVLDRGRVALEGPPDQVFASAGLIGAVRLRLPYVGEVFHRLERDDGIACPRLPLTVGAARERILALALRGTP